MHRHTRSEAGDISSPRSSRAASFSSERPSVTGSVTFQMPSSVRPQPAYIAASVASQTVTDHHNAQLREDNDSDQSDPDPPLGNAIFSEPALSLLNAFLDHLLFAFLSTARSPSLTAIRPAISDVLKPRLAREAMATADEELQGLLAGDDEEEFPAQVGKASDRWDVEKVWKRTRLRIMVYTRLGELEDEDEERYVQQERGLSMDADDDDEAGLVSWASAIFLTSVIEYVAEQTLLVSGQAAYARLAAKLKKQTQFPEDGEDPHLERIVVEDFDVEKVALNSALGRLWRTWRKRVRSPITPLTPTRGLHYMSSFNSLHRRRISHDTMDESVLGDGVPEMPEHKPTETEIAANIPLPIGDNDVNEIEVPGLAQTFEEETESSGTQTPIARPQRPSSFIQLAPVESFRRRLAKERPVSMPHPPAQPFEVPAWSEEVHVDEQLAESSETATELPAERTADAPVAPPTEDHKDFSTNGHAQEHSDTHTDTDDRDLPFQTPMERLSDDESYIQDEHQESIHQKQHQKQDKADDLDDDGEADADMVAFAASTGMGFGMSPINPSQTKPFEKQDDDIETFTQTGDDDKGEVLQSKRISVERRGPPGIIRTYSTRSSSLKSPVGTPGASTHSPEGRSYLYDDVSDEEPGEPEQIGVAHTSNMPIRQTPSPHAESPEEKKPSGHAKHPSHGGYVEVLPRQVSPTPITIRRSPTPGEMPSPISPRRELQRKDVPQRAVDREIPRSEPILKEFSRVEAPEKDIPRREDENREPPPRSARREPFPKESPPKEIESRAASKNDTHRASGAQQQAEYKDAVRQQTQHNQAALYDAERKEAQRKEHERNQAQRRDAPLPVPVAAPRSRDISPPKSRGTTLSMVKEVDSWPPPPHGSPVGNSPRQSTASHRSREGAVSAGDRSIKNEGSPRSRSAADGSVEKASLQRVSSSSTRSVSTSILHTGRDSDISLTGRPRGLTGRMSQEDREREFDSLVKGEDTVKYTLTPQQVRDMDEEPPVVKRVEQSARPSTSSVTVYPRVSADRDNSFGSHPMPSRSTSRSKGPTAAVSKPAPSKKVGAKPLAREPRIQTESMRDFADFIRSTGPAPDQERPVQPFVPLSPPPKANGSSSSIGALGRKLSVRQNGSHSHSNSSSHDGPSARPRVHMEPRSPAGQRTGNDDLIDFIRQGPPGANNGQHRIPRSVAPFRTTVDSDQFDRMLDDSSNIESAYGSQVSTASKQSSQTVNSRTGLLPTNNGVVQPAYSNTPQKLTGSMSQSTSEPHVQRTRRRVKDPYAIDISDEEDDDMLTALPKSSGGPNPKEEGFLDFLNSNEPPPSNQTQPFVLSPATVAAAKARNAQNASYSATSLPSARNSTTSPRSGNPMSPPPGSMASPMSDAPRANKPRLQARAAAGPREARSTRSGTDDLADFLRNSGPPEPPAPAPNATVKKEEGKRRFWRKKTYPDMP